MIATVTEKDVKGYAAGRLAWLAAIDEGERRALLARLRRQAGRPPGSDPALREAFLGPMPPGMAGSADARAAVLAALSAYAAHQQGAEEGMHRAGRPPGAAAGLLAAASENPAGIARRLNGLALSDGAGEAARRLQGLVRMMGREGIPMDYGELAGDLYAFASPRQRERVRLKWGMEFYRALGRARKGGKDDGKEPLH